ncbi:MAG: HlyD family secretion protein [Prevotella sp.]
MRKIYKTRTIIIGSVMLLLIAIASIVGLCLKPKAEPLQGEADLEDYRVSTKVPSRVVKFYVQEGQRVKKGDTLAILESPELDATLSEATSSYEAQQARQDLVDNGSRKEQIARQRQIVRQARSTRQLAEATYRRIKALFEEGVVAKQRFDEAEASYNAAVAAEKAAIETYNMTRDGAREEEKRAAKALTQRSQSNINRVKALKHETVCIAAEDGIVTEIFPEVGEFISTGAPIMNVDTKNVKFTFFLKEDQLPGVELGQKVKIYVPAIDKTFDCRVSLLKNLGNFAAWKATRMMGQYDLKVFEVEARPLADATGVRKEMSALLIRD